jgi:radical SAM protein with 4Fe4S-binding SPASM domain
MQYINLKLRKIGAESFLVYKNYEKVMKMNKTSIIMFQVHSLGLSKKDCISKLMSIFNIEKSMLIHDYDEFVKLLNNFEKGNFDSLSQHNYNIFDEITLQNRLERNILNATFELTNICNFKCKHCYVDKKQSSFINTERTKELITELSKIGCYSLLFTGGEATLHPDFCEIYSHAYSLGFKITIYTNGYHLTEELKECFIDKKPSMIAISLYGYDNISYEYFTKMPEAFNRIMNSIKFFKQNNIPIQTRTQLHSETKEIIKKIYDISANLNIPFNYGSNICPPNDPTDLNLISMNLLPEEIHRIKELVPSEPLDREKNLVFSKKMLNSIPPQLKEIDWICGGGITSCLIDSELNISPCVQLRIPSISMTNSNISIEKAWMDIGEKINLLLKNKNVKKQAFKCHNCDKKYHCAICPAWIIRVEESQMDEYIKEKENGNL